MEMDEGRIYMHTYIFICFMYIGEKNKNKKKTKQSIYV